MFIGFISFLLTKHKRGQKHTAARLLTGTKKREHITPVLSSLHWLPVSCMTVFWIILFAVKSLTLFGFRISIGTH